MKNRTDIPILDMKECFPGADFIIKTAVSADMPARLRKPHRNSGYKIGLLLEGEIASYTDFKKFHVQAPALFFLSPDQVHQHAGNAYHKMIHIAFSKDFLLTETQGILFCWECMFNRVSVQVRKEELQELITYTNLMQQEFAALRPQRDFVIRNLLNAFIIAVARLSTCESKIVTLDNAQNKIVRQFKSLTDEHFVNRTQVAEYADMLYITPGYLNDTIKAATGRTAKQIIDEKRILEAKRLLFWGEKSVKQIAGDLNFEDDGYFNRFFKKHVGQTPAIFQKINREKYN